MSRMKRILSLVLVMVMLCSFMPAGLAFGEELDEVIPAETEEIIETEETTEAEEPTETEEPAPAEETVEEPVDTEEPAETEVPIDTEEPAETEEPEQDPDAEKVEKEDKTEDEESEELPCTLSEGCTLPDGHEGDCLIEDEGEEEDEPCTLTEGCILPAGHEGECELEEEEEQKLPFGFLGMPEDYELSEAQLADKQYLIDNGVLSLIENSEEGLDYVAGQIVFTAETEEEAELIAAAYRAELESFFYGVAVANLAEATVYEAVSVAADMELIMPAVEPNYIINLEPVPGEEEEIFTGFSTLEATYRKKGWEDWKDGDPFLSDPGDRYNYQWMHDLVNSYEAWGVTTGRSDIKVAVIDTGVYAGHEDLSGKVVVRDTTGFTGFSNNDDENGHGTHCAGIIAAKQGNHKGGAGIAPNVTIYSYRVMGPDGGGTGASIASAINMAVNDGVDIISMSLGGYFPDSAGHQAVDRAYNYGVTVVVAMGNDGYNTKCYPAAYDHVIAVTSVKSDLSRSGFSNYGPWADIAAPGSRILSTYIDGSDSYVNLNGTSMACPVVAGVAALYMSKLGHVAPDQMAKVLKKSVSKISGTTTGMGAGIVDAAKLFEGDKTAPSITVKDRNGVVYAKPSTVDYESKLVIAPVGSNGNTIVYTTDNKTPTLKNGELTVGQIYTGEIALKAFAGKKVTIKAACINGMGVISSVKTLSVTVKLNPTPTSVEIVTAPSKIVAGKTETLTAKVNPLDANQKVTWSIVSRTGCPKASINATTGALKTVANESGSVTVRASSVDNPSVKKDITIPVVIINPVYKMSLNKTTATLYFCEGGHTTTQLSVQKAEDNKKNVLAVADYSYSWKSSNTKVATVDANGKVTPVGKGTATITCTVLDGSKKTATCTVKVVRQADSITISGLNYVSPGRSYTYKATILPSNTDNKKVTWSYVDVYSGSLSGITLNSSTGILTVAKTAQLGTSFRLAAQTNDGNPTTDTIDIYVGEPATAVSLHSSDSRAVYNTRGVLTGVTIYSHDLPDTYMVENLFDLYAVYNGGADEIWASSNPKVATVDANGRVTGHAPGTATISCTANDCNKRKASVSVKVVNPVSYITIMSKATVTKEEVPCISMGKSVSNSVVFGDTYGVPTNKKVVWDYVVTGESYSDGNQYDLTDTFRYNKLITLSNGSLSVKNNATTQYYWRNYDVYISVIATAQDGSYASDSFTYVMLWQTTKMFKAKTYTERMNANGVSVALPVFGSDSDLPLYTVTSSNPNVASPIDVVMVTNSHGNPVFEQGQALYKVRYSSETSGTATITVKTTDGSGKSLSFTVTRAKNSYSTTVK